MKGWTLLQFSSNERSIFENLAIGQSHGHSQNSFVSSSTSLFVNASADDYHLKSGTPAIDYGFVLSDVTDDLEGKPRRIGVSTDPDAYETGAGCTDSAPPSTSITSRSNGAPVSGIITISANASDDCSLNRVEFFVDDSFKGIVVY